MKRIFMLSNHPLLSQGVESLLRQEKGLEIVGREVDVDKAVERIKALRPDAVILDSAEPSDPAAAVIRILNEGLGTKVIGLNIQNNTMCIYSGEHREVGCIEDLIGAIEHNAFSPAPASSEGLVKVEGAGDALRQELMEAFLAEA